MTEYFRPCKPTIVDAWGQPLDHPVVVVDRQIVKGIKEPGALSDWYHPDGTKGGKKAYTYDPFPPWAPGNNTRGVKLAQKLWDLYRALQHVHRVDAHAPGYVLVGPDGVLLPRVPRVTIQSIDWLRNDKGILVLTYTIWVDLDNPYIPGVRDARGKPARRPWDDELIAQSDTWMATIELLRYATRYRTRGGQRFVFRLEVPVDTATEASPLIAQIFYVLSEEHGVRIDEKCKDITRVMRLPNVIREDDGLPYTSTIDHLPAPPLPAALIKELIAAGRETQERARVSKIKPRAVRVRDIPSEADERQQRAPRKIALMTPKELKQAETREMPAKWQWLIDEISQSAGVAAEVHGQFHYSMLALAGALIYGPVDVEAIPPIVYHVAKGLGSTDPDHHHDSALQTMHRMTGPHSGVTGQPTLDKSWPLLGRALRRALGRMGPAKSQRGMDDVFDNRIEARRLMDLDLGFTERFVRAYQMRPGSGKTRTAIDVAVVDAGLYVKYKFADLRFRTAYCAPTNELAAQTAYELNARGVVTLRLFSPASAKDAAGKPLCLYPAHIKRVADAGGSIQRDVCAGGGKYPCKMHGDCEAEKGFEGDETKPHVLVTTHAKLHEATSFVGTKGRLVIDEPGSLLVDEELATEQLSQALKYDKIERRYMDAMGPLLHSMRAWLEHAETEELGAYSARPLSFTDAADEGFHAGNFTRESLERIATLYGVPFDDATTDGALVVALAVAAFTAETSKHGTSCPVDREDIYRGCIDDEKSRWIAVVVKTYNTLYATAVSETAAIAERIAIAGSATRPRVSPPALWAVCPAREVRRIVIKRVDPVFDALLREAHSRRITLLDANLDVARPVIEMVTGQPMDVTVLTCRDNVAVERTWWSQTASRSLFMDRDRVPQWDALLPVFDRIGRYLKAGGSKDLLFVTFKQLSLPLAIANGNATDRQKEQLAELTEDGAAWVAGATACIAAMRAHWNEDVTFAHYGSLKGLNSFIKCDVAICMGDPRDNLGAVQREVQYTSAPKEAHTKTTAEIAAMTPIARGAYFDVIEQAYSEKLVESRAKAAYEQAMERLRAACREFTARMLAIGTILPGGVGWDGDDVIIVTPNDEVAAMAAEAEARLIDEAKRLIGVGLIKLGTLARLSDRVGVSEQTLRNWRSGKHRPTSSHIDTLRSIEKE